MLVSSIETTLFLSTQSAPENVNVSLKSTLISLKRKKNEQSSIAMIVKYHEVSSEILVDNPMEFLHDSLGNFGFTNGILVN